MGVEKYYEDDAPGTLWLRPVTVRLRCTFSGGAITKSTTRRQSDPDVVAAGTGGTYTFTGLPKVATDYHITSCELFTAAGTQLVILANVSAFSASAGTMTVLTRQSSDGAVTAPPDTAVLFLQFDAEAGAY